MRYVIHTPRTQITEWEVIGLPDDASDVDVFAAIENRAELPDGVSVKRVSTGTVAAEPFVYARVVVPSGEDELELAGKRIRAARVTQDEAVEAAWAVAAAALDAGTASERQVAAAMGVDRNTLRSWRGKAR